MHYTVIGAGPMGLMTALELLEAGHRVDVYERDDRLGGMSASFDFDGTPIERYYHFICRTDFALFDVLGRLGLSDALKWTATKMGYFHDGTLHPWGTPMALLRFPALGFIDKARYALHVLWTKRQTDWRRLDRVNATAWLKRWLGERAYEVLWHRVFLLKFFEYTDNLSAAWIGTRIKRIALSRRSLTEESLGYLEGGSERVLAALHARILALGGRVHLAQPVGEVVVEDGRVRAVMVGGEARPTDGVLSTMPLRYVPALAPMLPEDYLARIRALHNIPVACVILKLAKPLTGNFWLNINDPAIEIPGLIEYSNLNPGTGAHILYAPFYMPRTHPKWSHANEQLIDEVIGYLGRINPGFRPDWVLARHCHRYEYAQPICPPGFYDMLPPMRTPLEGLFIADTSYYYPEDRSINESFATGAALAREALGAGAGRVA